MNTDPDRFYLNKEEPAKSCLLAMRTVILQQDSEVTETIKYGMPCFCFRNKMFCYLWMDKKTGEPYMLMVEGKYLEHPALEAGKRSRMKVFRVYPNIDLPLATIRTILKQGLDLYRKGIIKIK